MITSFLIFTILFSMGIYYIPTIIIFKSISYCLAYVIYFLNIRKSIIEYNLKQSFPSISQSKLDFIRFHSNKVFIFNVLIGIKIWLLGDSNFWSLYDNNIKINSFPNKCFFCACHLGIYYDLSSLPYIFNKNVTAIYKGNFSLKSNKKIEYIKHNQINKNTSDFFKKSLIITPIDQNPPSHLSSEVKFLNSKVSLHNFLIKLSMNQERDIYFAWVLFPEQNKLRLNYIKINYNEKSLNEVCQIIANKMSELIIKYPEQYFWMHDRFKLKIK